MHIKRDLPCFFDSYAIVTPENLVGNFRIQSGKDVTVMRLPDPDHTWTVLDLKKHAAAAALEKVGAGSPYIRFLIRNGRMLAPDCASLQDLGVATGDVIHAVMTSLTTTGPVLGDGAGAGTTSVRQQPQGPP
jgi:F420-0:gamma-glutamyl ligase-like protein